MIEKIVGYRPTTCPWRAYYDPLVIEVINELSWAVGDGNLPAVVDATTPAILIDALAVYQMALKVTMAEERKLREEQRKREAEALKNRR